MDLKAVIAAVPFLRRLWRWLPGPLRIVVLVLAVFFWFRSRGEQEPSEAGGAAEPPAGGADATKGSEQD